MRTRLFLVVSLLLGLAAAPARAADDATDPPTATGPLLAGEQLCDESPTGLRSQSCSWWFDLAPAHTNPAEDYFAYWFQLELDPPRGMCATDIQFGLDLPDGMRIASATPDRSARVRRAEPAVTRLEVDAEGGALVTGSVENELTAAPGRVDAGFSPGGYGYSWRGSWPGKLVVAVGMQIAGERIPQDVVYQWFGGEGFGVGACAAPRSGR